MSTESSQLKSGALALLATVIVLAGLIGCGQQTRTNKLRPPAPLTVNVVIGRYQVSASASKFGGGPTNFVVSNQSGSAQKFVISDGRSEHKTASITNLDSASIELNLLPGQYTASAADNVSIEPQTLTVGAERPSSQNDLLLP